MGISPEKLLKKRGHAKKSYKKIAQMIKDKTGEEIPAHYKHIDKYAIEKLGLKAGKGGFTNFDQMYDQIEASLSTGGADTEPSGKAMMPTSGEFEDTQKLKLRDPEDAGLQGAAVPKPADAERARRIAQTKKDFAYTPPEGAHEKWRDIQRKQAEKNRPLGKKVDRFIDKTFQQGSLKGQEILDKAKTIPKRLKKAADQAAIGAQDADYDNVLSPRERRTNAGSFQESLRETIAQQLRSEPKFQYLFEDSVESKVVDTIIENLMKYDYFRKLALTSSKKTCKIVKMTYKQTWKTFLKENSKMVGFSLDDVVDRINSFENNTWIFFDTETMGFNPKIDQITEIGAMAVDPKTGKMLGDFDEFIKLNPTNTISPQRP